MCRKSFWVLQEPKLSEPFSHLRMQLKWRLTKKFQNFIEVPFIAWQTYKSNRPYFSPYTLLWELKQSAVWVNLPTAKHILTQNSFHNPTRRQFIVKSDLKRPSDKHKIKWVHGVTRNGTNKQQKYQWDWTPVITMVHRYLMLNHNLVSPARDTNLENYLLSQRLYKECVTKVAVSSMKG